LAKRAKEREEAKKGRVKDKAKVDAEKERKAADQEKAKSGKKASRGAEVDGPVYVGSIQYHTPRELARMEAKAARKAEQQSKWSDRTAEWSKAKCRNYYKDTRAKPKGKRPAKLARTFADL